MKKVLFACVHNAGRSQMAAAFFNALADPVRARAISAGTAPASRVHPEVVEVMREVGIDLSGVSPQKLTADFAHGAALLVTMGCGEQCPLVPGMRRDDWLLEDPKGQSLDAVRRIRDDVHEHVRQLISDENWGSAEAARPPASHRED
jgi:arsenate reductase